MKVSLCRTAATRPPRRGYRPRWKQRTGTRLAISYARALNPCWNQPAARGARSYRQIVNPLFINSLVNRLRIGMFFESFFSSSRHCVDAQCDADAAADTPCMSPGAADAAEQLSDYMRLIQSRPSVPPAPSGTRPEHRLRTYHPIPQQSAGAVIVIQGLPASLRDVGFAVWCAMRGGFDAADVAEARRITTARPHQSPQTASIPSSYTLPAAARAVLGDDLPTAITGAAAVYYAAHEYTAHLQDRRDRTAKYGAVTPIAPGVVINGGAPDNTAKGAVPLTPAEEKLLARWLKIRQSECWLETPETFEERRAAYDTAARAHEDGKKMLRQWQQRVREHPMRAVLQFQI